MRQQLGPMRMSALRAQRQRPFRQGAAVKPRGWPTRSAAVVQPLPRASPTACPPGCTAAPGPCCEAHASDQAPTASAESVFAPSASQVVASFFAALQLFTAGLMPLVQPPPAQAMLRSPNANISRSVDAALRRAIPPFNRDVRTMQTKLEEIQYLLRIPQRRPWGSMAESVRAAQGLAFSRSKMMEAVPRDSEDTVTGLLAELNTRLERLQFAIDRQDADKTSAAVARALETVADIELVQAPALAFLIPKEFERAPLLTGRAIVEMLIEKADGSPGFVDAQNGGLLQQGVVQIAIDGYSAPVSAGNFAALVLQGKYDGMTWTSGFSSVVTGAGANPGARVPLEILPIGDFSPVYRSALDIRGGEYPVLPLSIRGAVSMTRVPDSDQFLSGEEFFIHKFSPDQGGLSGLAFDEGTFGVFGYVIRGMESVVARLENGDRIVSARIISGQDRLKNVSLPGAPDVGL